MCKDIHVQIKMIEDVVQDEETGELTAGAIDLTVFTEHHPEPVTLHYTATEGHASQMDYLANFVIATLTAREQFLNPTAVSALDELIKNLFGVLPEEAEVTEVEFPEDGYDVVEVHIPPGTPFIPSPREGE